MKEIPTLTFLCKLIELHEIHEYWQLCQGDYFKVDLITLFNSKMGEVSKLIKENKLFYK